MILLTFSRNFDKILPEKSIIHESENLPGYNNLRKAFFTILFMLHLYW